MVLSAEDESSNTGAVDGLERLASGLSIDGEKETLYTGAEWPMRRRELLGAGSLPVAREDFRGSPWRFQTRM